MKLVEAKAHDCQAQSPVENDPSREPDQRPQKDRGRFYPFFPQMFDPDTPARNLGRFRAALAGDETSAVQLAAIRTQPKTYPGVVALDAQTGKPFLDDRQQPEEDDGRQGRRMNVPCEPSQMPVYLGIDPS